MNPRVVGLLAAVGAALVGVVGLLHGDLTWIALAGGSAATGVAASLALVPNKKNVPRA